MIIFGVDPELGTDLRSPFFTAINITQIRLYIMYFDSAGGAVALLSNYAAGVYETMHELWRSLNSLSTVQFIINSE